MEYIIENEILTDYQHGFVPGRYCATQLLLLQCVDYWTDMLDQGHSVDTIYLDFAKAFDSVPHERLLEKDVSPYPVSLLRVNPSSSAF